MLAKQVQMGWLVFWPYSSEYSQNNSEFLIWMIMAGPSFLEDSLELCR